jgi:hypothetical protein
MKPLSQETRRPSRDSNCPMGLLSRFSDYATGWTNRVQLPMGARDFCLLHGVQSGSGAHRGFYPMGTGDLSPEVKRPAQEANHSPPSVAEV